MTLFLRRLLALVFILSAFPALADVKPYVKEDLASDPRALEIPLFWTGLLRAFAARRIWADQRLERPDVLHVLDDELVDVALGLAEIGHVPYVQTVADFASIERGLRLSRQWSKQNHCLPERFLLMMKGAAAAR